MKVEEKKKDEAKEKYSLSDEARKKIISQIPVYLQRYGCKNVKDKR